MKKWTVCLLILCLGIFCLAPACAAGTGEQHYITDEAGLLQDSQRLELERQAKDISQRYGCGVYLVTVGDYTDTAPGSVYDCARVIYTQKNLGLGAEQNGLLLLLSMEDRDYSLISHGTAGNAAFTDYGKDVLTDAFLPALADNDWYEGFQLYLEQSETLLAQAAAGHPVDAPGQNVGRFHPLAILFSLVLGSGVAAIVCLILKGSMKSVREAAGASAYLEPDGVQFTIRQDHFTHRTQTRRKIETEVKSSSSGGSGGFSGKSGKF